MVIVVIQMYLDNGLLLCVLKILWWEKVVAGEDVRTWFVGWAIVC